jgi:hypothetical protein
MNNKYDREFATEEYHNRGKIENCKLGRAYSQ